MRSEVIIVATLVCAVVAVYAGGFALYTLLDTSEATEPADDPEYGSLSFLDVSGDAGIDYESDSDDGLTGTQAMMSNSGIYVTDVQNNGHQDLLFVGGTEPELYVNDGGSYSRALFPSVDGDVRAALFFDRDGDGSEDLLLLRMHAEPLFFENRDGQFVPDSAGFDDTLAVPIGAAAADYTGNGCLDVFVIQNGDWTESSPVGQVRHSVPDGSDNGEPNVLYRGDCESFTAASEDAGITGDRWSLATTFVDLTGNDRPDIHVANDFNRDIVYINEGDGTFERTELGMETNRNGMSSTVADVTGNGNMDLFVTNIWFSAEMEEHVDVWSFDYTGRGNNLLINQGDGTFEPGGETFNVTRGGWGWAATLADFSNDGTLDLVHATRHYEFTNRADLSESEHEEIHETYPFYRHPAVWEGLGDEFVEVSAPEVGFDVIDSRGLVAVDYNHNGQLDIGIANNAGSFSLYENTADTGNWIIVDVEGDESVTNIGASVSVEFGDERKHRVIESNTDYLSQGERRAHVGLGAADSATITVSWQDGPTHEFDSLDANAVYSVDPAGTVESLEP